MRLPSGFTKKQKILVCSALVVGVVAHFAITAYQENAKLLSQLENGEPEAQIEAAYALADSWFSAQAAVPELSYAVTHPNSSVRAAATLALLEISRRDAIEALNSALAHRSQAVRLDAVEALERIGSPRALEALSSYSSDTKRSYQRASLGAWAEKFRRKKRAEDKKRYRRHLRIYGNRR